MSSDWIDDFMLATEKIPSPEPFRLWSAISAISGAMERKTWTTGTAGPIFPNVFCLLVGPPGTGKTNSISIVRNLWSKLKGLYISPDDVTKASLLDALSRSLRTVTNGPDLMIFHSLNVAAGEFGVFFTNHDTNFLSVLNYIFDGPPIYRQERRTSEDIEITRPVTSIIAGTQPDFLGTFMPDEAWGMGFTSRLIMIYAGEKLRNRIIGGNNHEANILKLVPRLNTIFNLVGEFIWESEALAELEAWQDAGEPPVPEHNKLRHYSSRRLLHVIKLSMISAVSRAASLTVTVADFERAREWLLAAEAVMPDVFYSMVQKSDDQIIDDVHYYTWQMYCANGIDKRKAIKEELIMDFLSKKAPSWQVPKIFELACKRGIFHLGGAPGEWHPRPRNQRPEVPTAPDNVIPLHKELGE